MKAESPLVFDSFVILAFLRKEKGADRVRGLLQDVQDGRIKGHLSVANLAEILCVITRRQGADAAATVHESLLDWGIRIVALDQVLAIEAARIKAANALSMAGAFCAAAAARLGGVVVTGDPEIKRIDGVRVLDIHG